MNIHDDNVRRNVEIAQEFYRRQEKRRRIIDHASWASLGAVVGGFLVAVAGRLAGAW
jgi:hypothetical protein